MFLSKVIVSLILLSVAIAERPRVGLQMPSILPSLHPQIVGGEEAPEDSYPFIVSLQVYSQHFCAGSILNEQWIVTAGHCIQMVSSIIQLVSVKAGKHNVRITEENEQIVRVEQNITHEKFEGTDKFSPYDIGLLKLASPLNLTKQVQTIELAPPESEPTGEAWLCGWGSISNTSLPEMPDKLQHVKMEYIDRSTCNETVERLMGVSPIHETNICTGPLYDGISACIGDSGGPLISRNGEKAVLTGIVSWSINPCGSAGAPSVYTKVSIFNDWIAQQIGNY